MTRCRPIARSRYAQGSSGGPFEPITPGRAQDGGRDSGAVSRSSRSRLARDPRSRTEPGYANHKSSRPERSAPRNPHRSSIPHVASCGDRHPATRALLRCGIRRPLGSVNDDFHGDVCARFGSSTLDGSFLHRQRRHPRNPFGVALGSVVARPPRPYRWYSNATLTLKCCSSLTDGSNS